MNSKFAGFRGQLQVTFCRYDQFVVMWGRWDTPQNFFLAFMFLRYGACDGQNFFSFYSHFCSFTLPARPQPYSLKNQNLEKVKKTLEISSFYISVPKIMISWCTVPDMVPDGCNYFSFWVIFCPFNPLKSEKNVWRYHHFTYAYQKLWSDDVRFLRYGVWRM